MRTRLLMRTNRVTGQALRGRALRLSVFTVLYNAVECAVSLVAGAASGSAALIGFGLDSFLESLSGGVMIWRFGHHPGLGAEEVLRREKVAVKLVGYMFFVFGSYVLYESAGNLLAQERPEPSLVGIAVAVASLLVMPVLFVMKEHTGKSIMSRSLLADARQTLACVLLSLALLVGLGLNWLWGLWWADPAVGLLLVVFLFREGREALTQQKLCTCAAPGALSEERISECRTS